MPLSGQLHLPGIEPKAYTFRSGSAIARCVNIGDSGLSIKFSGIIGARQMDDFIEQITPIREAPEALGALVQGSRGGKVAGGRKTMTCLKAAIFSPSAVTRKYLDSRFGTVGAIIVMPAQYDYVVQQVIALRVSNVFRVVFPAGLEHVALAWLDIH